MRLSSAGSAGFAWLSGGGSRFRMASKTTAEVSPWNGQHPGGHLVEDRPQREEVGAGVRDLPARLLGRHVGHRAHRRARGGELVGLHRGRAPRSAPRRPTARALDLGEAEVQDLRLAPRVHEDVGGLEVPVDDPLRVRRLERVRDLDPHLQQRPELERPSPDPLAQRLALEQLHRDEVLALVLVDLVDGADAGVVEGGGGAGLALEALERGRVPRHLRGQELERDVAAELRVLGLVDDAHAAAAELRRDPVVRDRLADHSRPSLEPGGYSFSNSGSPWRSARSGSRRAQSGSRKPASQAFWIAARASGFFPSWQKTQAAL